MAIMKEQKRKLLKKSVSQPEVEIKTKIQELLTSTPENSAWNDLKGSDVPTDM